MTEYWIVLDSSGSSNYYENNTAYQFTIYFKQPIPLRGYWSVALKELYAKRVGRSGRKKAIGSTGDLLYIYSSLCEPIIVNGEQRPLLRRVNASSSSVWRVVLDDGYYIKCKSINSLVNEITIYITDFTGLPATFLDGEVSLTLHLKQYPFLI